MNPLTAAEWWAQYDPYTPLDLAKDIAHEVGDTARAVVPEVSEDAAGTAQTGLVAGATAALASAGLTGTALLAWGVATAGIAYGVGAAFGAVPANPLKLLK